VYFKLGETFMKGIFKSRLVLTGVALVLLVGALAVALVSNSHSHPALAYGKENWQIGFSGTGVAPSTGFGFGFWGWCAFSGVTSGTDGDCQISQYQHAPAGSGIPSFTCEESVDVTSWKAEQLPGSPFVSFVIETATVTVNPSSQTANCLAFFPGPNGFPADTGFPAAAGHYNIGVGVFGQGLRGEFQVQVVQIP
jgi:hypothetical protein